MYAVIATFNEEATKRVKEIWGNLELFTAVDLEGLEPHITLADYYHLDEAAYLQKLEKFTKRSNSFSIVFSSIGTFPSNGTVFLAPVVTKELQEVHRSFHEYFEEFLDYEQSYYVPDKWVPHCTIANRLDEHKFLRVIEYMYGEFCVEQASLKAIKVIKIIYEDNHPISFETIGEYELGKEESNGDTYN